MSRIVEGLGINSEVAVRVEAMVEKTCLLYAM